MALQWISDQVQLILIYPLLNLSGSLVGEKKSAVPKVSGETLIWGKATMWSCASIWWLPFVIFKQKVF